MSHPTCRTAKAPTVATTPLSIGEAIRLCSGRSGVFVTGPPVAALFIVRVDVAGDHKRSLWRSVAMNSMDMSVTSRPDARSC